jgi:hypothetical protein
MRSLGNISTSEGSTSIFWAIALLSVSGAAAFQHAQLRSIEVALHDAVQDERSMSGLVDWYGRHVAAELQRVLDDSPVAQDVETMGVLFAVLVHPDCAFSRSVLEELGERFPGRSVFLFSRVGNGELVEWQARSQLDLPILGTEIGEVLTRGLPSGITPLVIELAHGTVLDLSVGARR